MAASPEQTEQEFLASYDPAAYPPVFVTCDIVLLTIRDGRLCVLLVERGEHPYKNAWALPGGFVRADEDLEAAALRELGEEAGQVLQAGGGHLEQLGTYGTPGRDPRGRVVSVAWLALLADLPAPDAGTDAADARFVPVEDVQDEIEQLAFDHGQIIADALERARAKLEYTTLGTRFLVEPFTIAELRDIYEAVWAVELDASNFRRKVLGTDGFVEDTGVTVNRGRGLPAGLYRRGSAEHLHPPILRPTPDSAG